MSPASYQTAPPRAVYGGLEGYRVSAKPSNLPSLQPSSKAGNGTRTRDPNLGKVVLYQLSYSREKRPHRGRC